MKGPTVTDPLLAAATLGMTRIAIALSPTFLARPGPRAADILAIRIILGVKVRFIDLIGDRLIVGLVDLVRHLLDIRLFVRLGPVEVLAE